MVILGHILHDWDLDEKQTLLAQGATTRCRPGGAVIVYESIIDDDRRENAFGLLMSLNMLIETAGRVRLHRRRLPRLARGDRVPRDARRAPRRSRLDGDRLQEALNQTSWVCEEEAMKPRFSLVLLVLALLPLAAPGALLRLGRA